MGWGDDDETIEEPITQECQAVEPDLKGLRCSNPLCSTVFPVRNASSFESRIMTHVRDVTIWDPKQPWGVVRYYCPNSATAILRAHKAICELVDAQSRVSEKDSRFNVYERRIGFASKKLSKFFTSKHDCYDEAARAERKFKEYCVNREWRFQEDEFTPDQMDRLQALAKAVLS